jgi:hypothetical protein
MKSSLIYIMVFVVSVSAVPSARATDFSSWFETSSQKEAREARERSEKFRDWIGGNSSPSECGGDIKLTKESVSNLSNGDLKISYRLFNSSKCPLRATLLITIYDCDPECVVVKKEQIIAWIGQVVIDPQTAYDGVSSVRSDFRIYGELRYRLSTRVN